jgi:integrase
MTAHSLTRIVAEELARLGAALEDLKRDRLPHATALLVIALTGCRKSEILGLTWNEVKGRRLLLHDSKTGPRTVWMGDEARALLDALPRHPRHNRVFWYGEYVDLDSSVYFHFQAARAKAGLPKIRIHDLRHSFASHAAAMAETLPMIGKLLGHARVSSTARYAHLDDRSVIEAAERVGGKRCLPPTLHRWMIKADAGLDGTRQPYERTGHPDWSGSG